MKWPKILKRGRDFSIAKKNGTCKIKGGRLPGINRPSEKYPRRAPKTIITGNKGEGRGNHGMGITSKLLVRGDDINSK